MKEFKVKVYPSKVNLPKEDQLAYRIAKVASDNSPIDEKAADMVINRIIDNASVAIASFSRQPVTTAREMALAHPRVMEQQFSELIHLKNLIVNGLRGQMAQQFVN